MGILIGFRGSQTLAFRSLEPRAELHEAASQGHKEPSLTRLSKASGRHHCFVESAMAVKSAEKPELKKGKPCEVMTFC